MKKVVDPAGTRRKKCEATKLLYPHEMLPNNRQTKQQNIFQ